MLAESGRLKAVRQVIVNPSDEALWNLMSACSNTGACPCCLARILAFGFHSQRCMLL